MQSLMKSVEFATVRYNRQAVPVQPASGFNMLSLAAFDFKTQVLPNLLLGETSRITKEALKENNVTLVHPKT